MVTLTNPQSAPSGPTTAAAVSVSAANVGAIGPSFAGLSYEKAQLSLPTFEADNANMVGLFRALGASLLRIGGNTVDKYSWSPTGAGLTVNQIGPPDIDRLAAFCTATGWQVLYCVNLAQSTPALAASEVAYAAKALGASLYGIEIGNEPDNYAPFDPYPPPAGFSSWTEAAFQSQWSAFRSAILQAAPNVTFTGPASGNDIAGWVAPFAATVGKQVSLLTLHYYRSSGLLATDTPATLVTPDTVLQSQLAAMKSVSTGAGVPFRITETNSYYNGGLTGGDAYAAALWAIDEMFSIALAGGVGANYHGGGNKSGISPIFDNNKGVPTAVQPTYYGILFFSLIGQGALLQTTLAAGSLNVTAYTVKNSSQYRVVVVNKDPTQTLNLTLALPSTVTTATMQLMTGPSLDAATGITIQGGSVALSGAYSPGAPYGLPVSGSRVTGYVPPLGAALILAS